MIWLNAYNTNNNPQIICGYYLEALKQYSGCSRFVHADYGIEIWHVKNFQKFLMRHLQDGERSYIDGTSSANHRIESCWSYLRRQHLHFWIEAFRELLDNGNFSGNFIDKNLIQFCFTAIIQNELDLSIRMWINHNIRCSSNPRVPHGRPDNM
ncbi:hypothetical protein KUTeg_022143 [Tegillarca granosa]|uniref:Integrase core domain-containing protein n=1 Tax=Tegillarca granosa TaxID=220873 RepID=A0ABQ9E5J7_TEGGR|nr:hypothetical protein KUTeg_022143 [Tegillarca granosa]